MDRQHFFNSQDAQRVFTKQKSTKEIINMNGRLYDPVIGRFFSPDKYVVNSSFTQDFNRYSYARNIPLKYTDPSGEFIWMINAMADSVGYLTMKSEIER
jgi:RHS repeat-associated protein